MAGGVRHTISTEDGGMVRIVVILGLRNGTERV